MTSTLTIHAHDHTMPELIIERYETFVTLTVKVGHTNMEVFYRSGGEHSITCDNIVETLQASLGKVKAEDYRKLDISVTV